MAKIVQIEVEDEIDRLIKKLEHLKALRLEAADIANTDRYLTTKDVAEKLGVSESAAREYMNRPGFPLLEVGQGFKVSAVAFAIYNLEQRMKG